MRYVIEGVESNEFDTDMRSLFFDLNFVPRQVWPVKNERDNSEKSTVNNANFHENTYQ